MVNTFVYFSTFFYLKLCLCLLPGGARFVDASNKNRVCPTGSVTTAKETAHKRRTVFVGSAVSALRL